VDDATIATLRRQQELTTLPNGTEAVPATLQYRGRVPALPRAHRKAWLRDRFAKLYGDLPLDLESVSPTGQTVEVLLPLDRLEEVRAKIVANDDRVDIIRRRQAELQK
jgi:hypothetical protein